MKYLKSYEIFEELNYETYFSAAKNLEDKGYYDRAEKLKESYSLFENVAQAKSIVKKKMEDYEKLNNLLSKTPGYMGKFTEFLFNNHIPYEDLEVMYNDLRELASMNIKIDINKAISPEKLTDEIISKKRLNTMTKFISQFPSTQKKIARQLIGTSYETLLFNLSNSEKDLSAFITKISRYKNQRELIDAMKLFDKDAIRDREDILEHIKKNKNSDVIYDDNNLLIIQTKSIKDIRYLGSETAWCIKRESYWRKYTSGGKKQYILFNYNKDEYSSEFKIGFTLSGGGIYTSHDINDSSYSTKLREIFSKYDISTQNIYAMSDNSDVEELILKRTTSGTVLKKKLNTLMDTELRDFMKEVFGKVSMSKLTSTMLSFLEKAFERLSKYEKRNFTKPDIMDLAPKVSVDIINNIIYRISQYNSSIINGSNVGIPKYWSIEDIKYIIKIGQSERIIQRLDKMIKSEDDKVVVHGVSQEILSFIEQHINLSEEDMSNYRYYQLYLVYKSNNKEKFREIYSKLSGYNKNKFANIPFVKDIKYNFKEFIDSFDIYFFSRTINAKNKLKREIKEIFDKRKHKFDFKDYDKEISMGYRTLYILDNILKIKPDFKANLYLYKNSNSVEFNEIKEILNYDGDKRNFRKGNTYSYNGGNITIRID